MVWESIPVYAVAPGNSTRCLSLNHKQSLVAEKLDGSTDFARGNTVVAEAG